MTLPEQAVEAMYDLMQEADNLHDTTPNVEALLAAALPHLEKHFREQFAKELEAVHNDGGSLWFDTAAKMVRDPNLYLRQQE